MSGRICAPTILLMTLLGCSSLDPEDRVNEAVELVQEHTGQNPDWFEPPDSEVPVWGGQAVLTLDQALVLALRNNRDLRADLEMIGQANADVVQAGLLQNPVINFMIMFPDGGGRSMLRGQGLPMQPLQDLWLIPIRTKVAQADLQRAVLDVADKAVATAAGVKRVYARLQYTQRAIELLRESIQLVNQSTQIIQVRQSAGRATQTAVNLSQIRALRLQSELLSRQAEHRATQRELLMLMGIAAAADNWRVEPISETAAVVESPAEESGLLATAGEQRLDLQAAHWQVQSAEQSITLTQRMGWPELALGLGLERSPAPRSNNPSALGRAGNFVVEDLAMRAQGMTAPIVPEPPFGPKMREVKWTIGPMLEMTLPNLDWNQARTARARHEYAQRVLQYEGKLQEVIRMIREKRVMLAEAAEQVGFYRQSIMPAVERNRDVAQRSFVAGQEDLTVYLQVQEDLLMTRLKMLEFYREYLVNRADLERELGGNLAVSAATQPASQPG